MVCGGDLGQLAEAVGMLAEADSVARAHYGAAHPGRLSTLLDLREAMQAAHMQAGAVPDAPEVSAQYRSRLDAATQDAAVIAAALAERYASQGDVLSATLVAEAALQDVCPLLPPGAPLTEQLAGVVAQCVGGLSPADTRVAMSRKRTGGNLRSIAKEFTEELGVYALGRRASKLDQWNKGQVLAPVLQR
ncbi:hypothetical protein FOA52_013420 [Chlamydomonas sp. UWO 241]|nr:hypothetical protein FOA52_013420 [Chlamydomonas sp. UWO 241]